MKILYLTLAVAASVCCLAGCGGKVASAPTPVPTDSLEYSNHDGSVSCCSLAVDFPSGRDSFSVAVAGYIADELQRLCLSDSAGTHDTGVSPAHASSFTDGKAMLSFYGKTNFVWLQNESAEMQQDGMPFADGMEYSVSIRKVADNDRYVSYLTTSYMFLGGAHGSAGARTINIAKPSGKVLSNTVDTTRVMEMQPLLRKGVLEYFCANGDISVSDSTLNDNLFIEDGVIPLPLFAPYLTDNGLGFVYQQYEICCYAMGMVSFVIPYAEAKPFMTAEARALVK